LVGDLGLVATKECLPAWLVPRVIRLQTVLTRLTILRIILLDPDSIVLNYPQVVLEALLHDPEVSTLEQDLEVDAVPRLLSCGDVRQISRNALDLDVHRRDELLTNLNAVANL